MIEKYADSGFIYVWTYQVAAENRSAFETLYGPTGEWAQFFQKDPNYIGTSLHQDVNDPNRYITIDYWRSQSARDDFRLQHAESFAALDQRGDAMTIQETFVGDFQLPQHR